MKQCSKLRATNLELEEERASRNDQKHEGSSQKVSNCSECPLKAVSLQQANFADSF